MQAQSSSTHGPSIDVTPLIDILLVLLIIFMVIQPTVLRGLDAVVPQPARDRSADPDPRTLVVQIRPGSDAEALYSINGVQAPLAALQSRLASILQTRETKVVFVHGDPSLNYSSIVPAVEAAQRAGAQNIGILTPRSMQP